MKKNKKAFTLIELIAVLVILAIIALIVTPLVMNIVKKSKDSANRRSVDAYGKAVELGVATYLLDTGYYPTNLDSITIEYSGNEVVCNTKELNNDGSIYLSGCSVSGTEVKDANNEDGYYHYGKTINTPPKYQAYNIGDMVTYNGMNFYVIAPSDANSDSVTLLKEEPLTVDEVNTYGAGHINKYTSSSVGTAYDYDGYGGMAYYSSATCKRINYSENIETGCTTDYNKSEVKYVVDAWSNDKLNESDLKEDSLGYKTRLITFDELISNLGFERVDGTTSTNFNPENTPSWVYDGAYWYWTMSAYDDSNSSVWDVSYSVTVSNYGNTYIEYNHVVRPVITLLKSAI